MFSNIMNICGISVKLDLTKDQMVLIKQLLHYQTHRHELYDATPRTGFTPSVGSDVVSGQEFLELYMKIHQKDILEILETVFYSEKQ